MKTISLFSIIAISAIALTGCSMSNEVDEIKKAQVSNILSTCGELETISYKQPSDWADSFSAKILFSNAKRDMLNNSGEYASFFSGVNTLSEYVAKYNLEAASSTMNSLLDKCKSIREENN